MNNNVSNLASKSDPNWQLVGDLELPISANVEDALYAWLMEILNPLNLQAEFLNKIIESARDAITRTIHTEIILKLEHIHLTVFVPSVRDTKEKAWGFFRVEKIEDAKDKQVDGDHVVEFYLYGEGD